VLGQLAVEDKSKEITAVPKLLEMLTLRNTVVTADAMHCQRQIARQVVEQGGDYALALKGNQGSLQDDVGLFLGDPATPVAQVVQVSKGHGRIETRMASVSDDVAWLQEWHDWPGLQAVGKVRATRQKDDGTSEETRYYLLSRAFPPERFNDIVRGHWGIENRLHWVLDVTCNEDQARNRKGHCAENLALLRKLALNLARLEPGKGSMRGKLKKAGWDNNFLISILSQFTKIHMR
jgi:predicted transposase YbfD/YdcC